MNISKTKNFQKISKNNNNININNIITSNLSSNNNAPTELNNQYSLSSSPKKKIKSNLIRTPLL